MPVKNYGVWAATPVSYKAEFETDDPRSPHLTLRLDDSTDRLKTAPINVKSLDRDSRLVYWVDRNFTHPLTTSLRALTPGFHPITDPTSPLSLDYQRTTDPPLLSFPSGLLLPHDLPGPSNDILDELIPTVDRAIAARPHTKVYVFGSSFRTGVHDIHMNQGSLPRFDNGVGQDGALVFWFPDDDHFEAVFLAFASQRVPTDDEDGLPLEESVPLSEIAREVEVRN